MFDEECLICCFYGAANCSAHSHDVNSQLSDKNPIELEAKITSLRAKKAKLQADGEVGTKREVLLAQSTCGSLKSEEMKKACARLATECRLNTTKASS